MTWVYRNANTGQEVTLEQRDPCLDMLDNWSIISGPTVSGPAPVQDPGETGPVRPSEHDNKPAWVAYAVSRGMTESDARALSKAALIEEFGEPE